MTQQRKTYGDAYKSMTGHQLYQKMSLLELEKVRRQKELGALGRRVTILKEALQNLEGELTATRGMIEAQLKSASPQEIEKLQPVLVGGRLYNAPGTPDQQGASKAGRFRFEY